MAKLRAEFRGRTRSAARRNRKPWVVAALFLVGSTIAIVLWLPNYDATTRNFIVLAALSTAVFQASFLGIVYEFFLREELDRRAFERAGLSDDVVEHGLQEVRGHFDIQWADALSGTSILLIASNNPEGILGEPDIDVVIRAVREDKLSRVVIGSSSDGYDRTRVWRDHFLSRWDDKIAAKAVLNFTRIDNGLNYDMIATDTDLVIVLPSVTDRLGRSHPCQLSFTRVNVTGGVAADLNDQALSLIHQQAVASSLATEAGEPRDVAPEPLDGEVASVGHDPDEEVT